MTQEKANLADVLAGGGSATTTGITWRQRRQYETINAATRPERDSMGVIDVPAERHLGAQTQRSLTHFAISSECYPAN